MWVTNSIPEIVLSENQFTIRSQPCPTWRASFALFAQEIAPLLHHCSTMALFILEIRQKDSRMCDTRDIETITLGKRVLGGCVFRFYRLVHLLLFEIYKLHETVSWRTWKICERNIFSKMERFWNSEDLFVHGVEKKFVIVRITIRIRVDIFNYVDDEHPRKGIVLHKLMDL